MKLTLDTIGSGALASEFEDFLRHVLAVGAEQIDARAGGEPLYSEVDGLLRSKFRVEVTVNHDSERGTVEVNYKVAETLPGRRPAKTDVRVVDGELVVDPPAVQDALPFGARITVVGVTS